MPPLDGYRLCLSQLHKAGKVGEGFVGLTRTFVNALNMRSGGRYVFEEDFRVRPHHIFSFSKGRSGRKQLHVGFNARPPGGLFTCPWGASIGLAFDFRNQYGIITECVNEYEAFHEKVFVDPELFDATFGSLGGDTSPSEACNETVTAEKAWQAIPDMLEHWLFFGKQLTPDGITALGSFESFADECIRVFDVICEAGYYTAEEKITCTDEHKQSI